MSDFAAGASVGFGIQQRILAKKLREIEDARYKDETTYKRSRDKTADDQWARRQDWDESVTEYNAGRDLKRDAERRASEKEDRRLRQIELAMAMGGQGTQAMANGIRNRREEALNRARIAEMAARTEAIKAGRMGGSGGYGYDEYGADGELVKRRVPVGAGAGAPTGMGESVDPARQAVADEIAKLQTGIGQHQVQIAGGDNRTGFLNLQSRKGQIDDANAKIAKLRAMQGGAPAQPGAPAGQINPQDQQALQWAKANPYDPRAAAILQRLGAR